MALEVGYGDMVEKWARHSFISHLIIPALYHFFSENFIGQIKEALYSACLNLNHGKSNVTQKCEGLKNSGMSKLLTISTTSSMLVASALSKTVK